MDLQDQIVQEYLATGCGYRKLQAKYGISRTTICKWVQIYQGIHDLPPTDLQQKHYISPMEGKKKRSKMYPVMRLRCNKKLLHLKSSWHTGNFVQRFWIRLSTLPRKS